jgi:phosphatidylserine synthase
MRLATFVIALLLLAGSVDPTRGWLIALVVASGLAATRWRSWRPFTLRPALDVRMAAFVLAALLLAGVIDPTRQWLIVTAVVSGVALVSPRMLALDSRSRDRGWRVYGGRGFRDDWRRWDVRWGAEWDGEDWG